MGNRVKEAREQAVCSGYCRRCGRVHGLDGFRARGHALELMDRLDRFGRIDFSTVSLQAGKDCSIHQLFGSARGKMFGVLLCRDTFEKEVVLQAFSGQFNGHWRVDGWVEPLFDVEQFHRLNGPREKEVKDLGRKMETVPVGSREHLELRRRRKKKSRRLMEDIFSLYRVPNFRGEGCSLAEVFAGAGGMPTGTGDCCAPKLLAHAARNNLMPLSLAEFYYGRDNASASCIHKAFYPPCSTRCQPIIGYMLCGAGRS